MSTPTPDLVAALRQSFADLGVPEPRWRPPRDVSPLAFEDEDTLRRSLRRHPLRARHMERCPGPIRVDEYGYDRQGRYYPQWDGVA